jgi:hypothetical protein
VSATGYRMPEGLTWLQSVADLFPTLAPNRFHVVAWNEDSKEAQLLGSPDGYSRDRAFRAQSSRRGLPEERVYVLTRFAESGLLGVIYSGRDHVMTRVEPGHADPPVLVTSSSWGRLRTALDALSDVSNDPQLRWEPGRFPNSEFSPEGDDALAETVARVVEAASALAEI